MLTMHTLGTSISNNTIEVNNYCTDRYVSTVLESPRLQHEEGADPLVIFSHNKYASLPVAYRCLYDDNEIKISFGAEKRSVQTQPESSKEMPWQRYSSYW
jgi:hypothetical protein